MRYVVGARIPDGKYGIADGVYALGKGISLPFILVPSMVKKNTTGYIQVFDSIETIEAHIRRMRELYREEFVSRARKNNVSLSEFRFFPLKLDSSKMNFIKLGKFKDSTPYGGKYYEFTAVTTA